MIAEATEVERSVESLSTLPPRRRVSQPDAASRFREIAKEACKRHSDIDAAVAAVVNEVESDPDLLRDMAHSFLVSTARHTVHDLRHDGKSDLKRFISNPPKLTADTLAATARVFARAILEWEMPDGRKLGDWTGEELKPMASQETELAKGHQRNASFYAALAKKAGEARVRDKVSEKQAVDLWRKIAAE